MHCRIFAAAAAAALITLPAAADVTPHAGMLRFPDISRTHIAFVYAGDLWIVPSAGGTALPLATGGGAETTPRFSADGSQVAFVGSYGGARDVYVMPVAGGVPERVTWHPAGEWLCDWTPDGELLFSTGALATGPLPTLATVSTDGAMPEPLPLPWGTMGAIHGKGEWLAYTPHTADNRTWKRYRGGMATDIWLFNLATNASERVTTFEGTDTQPMWAGDVMYYLSDNGPSHKLNIWSYDLKSKKHTQVTKFDDIDVKWPAIGPGASGKGEIVFQHGSELKVLDCASKKTRVVEVTIPGDRPQLREQRVNTTRYFQSAGISATGKRAVVEARGDIWTVPAEKGSPRNLTRSSGSAERLPSWSPDGRWIAYFSDTTGEYELYLMQSDGKGETRQITKDSKTYYTGAFWAPDSKKLIYRDKSATIWLYTIADDSHRKLDQEPHAGDINPSWSHDSRWITYARTTDDSYVPRVWLLNVETGEGQALTAGMFGDSAPVFDRKGDWLYFASARRFADPNYSDLDTTFVYDQSQVLVAVPLRADVKSPWLGESDEETWKEEETPKDPSAEGEKNDEGAEGEDDDDGDQGAEAGSSEKAEEGDDGDDEPDAPASPIAGHWEGTIKGLAAMGVPPEMDSMSFTMDLSVDSEGKLSGSMTVMGETDEIDSCSFSESTGEFTATSEEQGMQSTMRGKLTGTHLEGTWEVPAMGVTGSWEADRTGGAEKEGEGKDGKKESDKPREVVEVEVEGFESRAFQIPVSSGNFGQLGVNDRGQLLYVRVEQGGPSIKLFDLKDREGGEKSVAAGAGGFDLSADGKKILVVRGAGGSIQPASAGGSGKPISTEGMIAMIDPRSEWKQVFHDAWRIFRDFFYVENMHGVDWVAVGKQYEAMIDDCATRADLSYVISEMISELNIGHAYYADVDAMAGGFGGPDVGLLGCDYTLEDGAYRIARILRAGPWDVDARSPLGEAGLGVKEGDYLLAVNDVPVDISRDVYAAFAGTANRDVTITVSDKPEMDDTARTVVVRPTGSEGDLRFRAWIERNRRYVDEHSGGKVGYIYVQDTGIDGQNDLFRQFYGQAHKDALIIDDRWNGGGQIPTRFIELLNRPVTNYWALRDGIDWMWPPDSHQGPKCMLINGLAGSGGDMFPWLFRHNGLGKLIGTRTWGGLVGISGNPGLIDGHVITVPRFAFYETDGTWGVEGHGVDPDIEVQADPGLMLDGSDPQMDAAIKLMLDEIKAHPYKRPARPKAPDRKGMGVTDEDK